MTAAKKKFTINEPLKETQPLQPRQSRSDAERGLVQVVFRMSKDGKRQLDIMAGELQMKKQEMLCEAWNDFLLKHGKEPTA